MKQRVSDERVAFLLQHGAAKVTDVWPLAMDLKESRARIAELERERDMDAERIGDKVEDGLLRILRNAGLSDDLDASGCDSGDPADYIAAQAVKAVVRAVDARDELEAQAGALRVCATCYKAERDALRDVCEEFVRRVEAGEVRSVHTYNRMKAALAPAERGMTT